MALVLASQGDTPIFQDFRFAIRTIRHNPGFAAVAVLSLALGIGANSAIFSVADGLLLRPVPVARPGELLTVQMRTPSRFAGQLSYPDYRDLRDKSKSFSGLLAYALIPVGMSEKADATPQVRYGLQVSGNFFDVLELKPILGRGFRTDEDQVPGRDAVMVLSYDLWDKQYRKDPEILKRTVRLNGVEFQIIGVAPESFTGMDQYLRPAFYLPIAMSGRLASSSKNTLEDRNARDFDLKGRLLPGSTIANANAEMEQIAVSLAAQYPETNKNFTATAKTELQARIDRSPPDSQLVFTLMVLVALVLLIACANVANLLMSRARSREREIAIRLAVGASRTRLIRQLLCESLVLSLLGGTVGLLVAYGGVRFFSQIQIPSDLPILLSIQLNERALLYAFVASIFSALLFGLIPAFQSTKSNLVPALKTSTSNQQGNKTLWGRNALVVAQVALSFVLVSSAALLFSQFSKLLRSDPGFRKDGLLMVTFNPSLLRYDEKKTTEFYRDLSDRIRNLPAVRGAAITQAIPFGVINDGRGIVPEGYQLPPGQSSVGVMSNIVDSNYFDVMGISVVRGRAFQVTDTADAPPVVIVNETVAKRFWPNQDAVGKRIKIGNNKRLAEIIGVARNSKYLWIAEGTISFIYLPIKQHFNSRMTLLVHTQGDPAAMTDPVRSVVSSIDANMPIFELRTMRSFYEARAVANPNLITETVAGMGFMGLTIALIGLYGLVAYSVSRRTREIGIRMAIGAQQSDVLRMVLRQGLILSATGVAIGWGMSLGVSRVLQSAITDVKPDEWVLTLLPFALLAVSMLAALVPALRASQIDPTRALRYE